MPYRTVRLRAVAAPAREEPVTMGGMFALLEGYPPWALPMAAVVLVFSAALVAAEFAARVVGAAVTTILGRFHGDIGLRARRAPSRLARVVVFVLVAAVLLAPGLKLAGVAVNAGLDTTGLQAWFYRSGLRIGLVLALAALVVRAAGLLVTRFEEEVGSALGTDSVEHAERLKRAQTLGRLLLNVIRTLVVGMAALMVLRELDVDVLPILTGASVVGLAVGFGAQTLVKDVIAGFFLLLENQLRVGDVASINGISGAVESITLRTISLRDIAGTVHVFPNGGITTLANQTKDFSFAVVEVGVDYGEDADHVVDVLHGVGAELGRDTRWEPDLLGPLQVLGIEALRPSEFVVKMRMKTRPTRQWDVARELRRRLKLAFTAAGIAAPPAHATIYIDRAAGPASVHRADGDPADAGAQ
ncbi:MAG: mechanosensitive ion channel family protein [Vicinamibacterales bacterium]